MNEFKDRWNEITDGWIILISGWMSEWKHIIDPESTQKMLYSL